MQTMVIKACFTVSIKHFETGVALRTWQWPSLNMYTDLPISWSAVAGGRKVAVAELPPQSALPTPLQLSEKQAVALTFSRKPMCSSEVRE